MSTSYFRQKERAKVGEEEEPKKVYFAQKIKSNRYYQNNRSWFGRRTPLLAITASLYQLSHLVSKNFVYCNEVFPSVIHGRGGALPVANISRSSATPPFYPKSIHSNLINYKVQYSLSPSVSFALSMNRLMIAFAMCESGFTGLF